MQSNMAHVLSIRLCKNHLLFSTNGITSVSVDVDGTTLTVDTDYLFKFKTWVLKLKNELRLEIVK